MIWANPVGGDWQLDSNWETGVAPNVSDDVVIPELSGTQTITSSNNVLVRSVTVLGDELVAIRSGVFAFANSSSFAGGIEIAGGTLTGSATVLSEIAVRSGGQLTGHLLVQGSVSLTGTGTLAGAVHVFGGVTNAGVIAPGFSPGCVAIDGDFVHTADGEFAWELNGFVPCEQHDQVQVAGTVTLAGPIGTINYQLFAAANGDRLRLIDNQGAAPVSGQFTDLPEGAEVQFGPYRAAVTYVGGDGNDVELIFTKTPWLVTTADDAGPGSLRSAILTANATPGFDTIAFDIPGAGVHSIALLSPLPAITDPVEIDGRSQLAVDNALGIELDGTAAGETADGLWLAAGSDESLIDGLVLRNFGGAGLLLESPGNLVRANQLFDNLRAGIEVRSADNTIGGDFASDGNQLSGSSRALVWIVGEAARLNELFHNLIGLGHSPEAQYGVLVENADVNDIGKPDAGNLFSGLSDGAAIGLLNARRNVVQANTIGFLGEPVFFTPPDNLVGVKIADGSTENTIGTYADGAQDEYESNYFYYNEVGVWLTGGETPAFANVVAGNVFGITQSPYLPPSESENRPNVTGIVLDGGTHENLIGGSLPFTGNLITESRGDGLVISGAGVTGNQIEGNWLGSLSGGLLTGNQHFGARVREGATDNVFRRNTVFGNGESGIVLEGVGTANQVIEDNELANNWISGVQVIGGASDVEITRNAIHENGDSCGGCSGIDIFGDGHETRVVITGNLIDENVGPGVYIVDASGNRIGGSAPGEENTITRQKTVFADNPGSGVRIEGPFAFANVVTGNIIAFNESHGVFLGAEAHDNVIGGPDGDASRNVISANHGAGVAVSGIGTINNTIQGNYIGPAEDGEHTQFVPNGEGSLGDGNLEAGIQVTEGASHVWIDRNVISGNDSDSALSGGIRVVGMEGGSSTFVTITGNSIGLSASGTRSLPNTGPGILLENAAENRIGGVTDAERNIISGQRDNPFTDSGGEMSVDGDGIRVLGAFASLNVIQGNYVGVDPSGLGLPTIGNVHGISLLSGAHDNLIGGVAPGAGNLIAGNDVEMRIWRADQNRVEGNRLGVDKDGLQILERATTGIAISQSTGNQIGGDIAGAGNLLGGFRDYAIAIITGEDATSGNVIAGNSIGIDATGLGGFGATPSDFLGDIGVFVAPHATNTRIGGVSPNSRNLIGNYGTGIRLEGSNDVVYCNFIGVGRDGQTPQPNDLGIYVAGEAERIGDSAGVPGSGPGNVISGNVSFGIHTAVGGDEPTVIRGNIIGLDSTGRFAVPSSQGGIWDTDEQTIIGGLFGFHTNVISGNDQDGILAEGFAATIQGNLIGLAVDGETAVGNGESGIQVMSSEVSIGDDSFDTRNVISGNAFDGISMLLGDDASIGGNFIGVNAMGDAGRPNGGSGVRIEAGDNFVFSNLISGNAADGITIAFTGQFVEENLVYGNVIGLNYSGDQAIPNQRNGVWIDNSSVNDIGGSEEYQRNIFRETSRRASV